jgi:hypothetical protein
MILLYTLLLCVTLCANCLVGMNNKPLTQSTALTSQELHKKETALALEKQKNIENLTKKAFIISINRNKDIECIPLETAQQKYPSMVHLFKSHQQVVNVVPVIIFNKELRKYFSFPHEFFLQDEWKIKEYINSQGNRIKINRLSAANEKSELRIKIAHLIECQRRIQETAYNLKINTTQIELNHYKQIFENLQKTYTTTAQKNSEHIAVLGERHRREMKEMQDSQYAGYQESLKYIQTRHENQINSLTASTNSEIEKLKKVLAQEQKNTKTLKAEISNFKVEIINLKTELSTLTIQASPGIIKNEDQYATEERITNLNQQIEDALSSNKRYHYYSAFVSSILLIQLFYYLYNHQLLPFTLSK